MNTQPPNQHHNLQALCTLSDSPKAVNPQSLTKLIQDSPDPETALRAVLKSLPSSSETLQNKWHNIVMDIWSASHPHIPALVDLPIAAEDVYQSIALDDAHAYLNAVQQKPIQLISANKEWLINAPDAHYLATQVPSLANQSTLQLENEWQYLPLRRLRTSLQSLRLIRRYKNQLVIVKSRYQQFMSLPLVHQYYLLWHADTYHVEWGDYAGIWGDYLRIVQEYLPLLWSISQRDTPDMAIDVRHWNKEMIESFYPLWQQAGLLDRQTNQTALLSLVRLQSLPTALTQVIIKDLFARFGLIYGQGTVFSYHQLGVNLLTLEHLEELPCNVELWD